MIRALLILGVAYRLRRQRRLLGRRRLPLAELDRVQDAVDRDLKRLQRMPRTA